MGNRLISKKVNNKLSIAGNYYLTRKPETLAGEIWKDVEGFEDLYQVSNLGRVKALPRHKETTSTKRGTVGYWTKELIRKQSIITAYNRYLQEYNFYLVVSLKADEAQTFMVARLVYQAFSKKKNELLTGKHIIHRDGDNLNNTFSNLQPASYSDIRQTSFDLKRRTSHFTSLPAKKRKMYSSMAVASNVKQITQYDLKGRRVAIHESLIAAAGAAGCCNSAISKALHKRYLTAGGYIWKAGKGKARIETRDVQRRLRQLHKHKCKQVIQYKPNGKKLAVFPSITAAAKNVGGAARQISDAVNGRSKTSYGFAWKTTGNY